jgi:hypothetical protein
MKTLTYWESSKEVNGTSLSKKEEEKRKQKPTVKKKGWGRR